MKTILVTGGTGYIGSHTVVSLLNSGYQVVIADNLSNSSIDCLSHIEQITGCLPRFYQVDLLDSPALDQIFCENQIDGVIHFAGLKAVGESVHKPLLYYHTNLICTMHLCEAMSKHHCKTLIFSSSATVYGMTNSSPMTENMPRSSTSPYGWSKVMQEQILGDFAATDSELSVLLLRYFNPIGAHPSGLIGEAPNGIPNNLMPYIAKVACGALPLLHVYGNDYDTPDGTCIRDYIHIMDLAEGHVQALTYAMQHSGLEAINLGRGHGVSVLEVIQAYENAIGRKIAYQFDARRSGDIAISYADTKKAEDLLQWQAKRSIEDMCRDSWNFTSNH